MSGKRLFTDIMRTSSLTASNVVLEANLNDSFIFSHIDIYLSVFPNHNTLF